MTSQVYTSVDMPGNTGETQISAYVSKSTKEKLEKFARARGLKKGFILEDALLHHMEALEELPPDVIIPPRLVVSQESWDLIHDRIENPRKPAPAMVKLYEREVRRARP